MTQAFEIWYFCGGEGSGYGHFSSFVEFSFPPLFKRLLFNQLMDFEIN